MPETAVKAKRIRILDRRSDDRLGQMFRLTRREIHDLKVLVVLAQNSDFVLPARMWATDQAETWDVRGLMKRIEGL
jgi:hypothetical protein